LGRNAAEVMTTIRDLGERGIVLRSLREGIDTTNATGRMIAGVLASLAELELELGRERRAAAREARRARGQHIGRPKVLDETKAALAQRMHRSGESASTIAHTLGVSRATVYRVLAEQAVLFPAYMVPFSIILHITTIRVLLANRRRARDENTSVATSVMTASG
jgi:DNA invertase Pin-like site-specific DNA recombinase